MQEKLPYIEKSLSSWSDYKAHIEKYKLEWVYRGQSNSNWPIRTSLERSRIEGPIERFESIEHQILEEFQRAAKHYLHPNDLPTTKVEWFALIQHYGSPTRLIDFTRSPYIAAYFAFEDEIPDAEFVTVWMVNCVSFYQRSIYYLEDKGFNQKDLKSELVTEPYVFSDTLLNKILDERLDCVIPLGTYNMNPRYLLQQSIFLWPCNREKAFLDQLDFLDESLNEAIFKINLPSNLRSEVIRDLDRMNITRASLFPGLDGFAKTLNMRYSTLTTVNEVIESLNFLEAKGYTSKGE